jgi:hypothetical protein
LGGPVFGAANPPQTTSGHASGPLFGNQPQNGQTAPAQAAQQPAQAAKGAAVAPLAGNGQPPPPPPPLKSQLPQLAAAIKPEFRDRYLAERQLRFPHRPGLYVWDQLLWIDSV